MQCTPFLWYLPHNLRPTRLSLIRPFLLNHTEETKLHLSCSYFHSPILVENALTYRYVHKTCNEIDATCHGQKLDFWLCHVAHCITNRSAAGFLLGLGLLMQEGSARRCFLGCERLLKLTKTFTPFCWSQYVMPSKLEPYVMCYVQFSRRQPIVGTELTSQWFDTRIMVYKKHHEIFLMPVSNSFQKWLYDWCLFVA